MSEKKPNASFKFAEDVKSQFAEATYYNGVTMTDALENFMRAYINATNKKKQNE